ncbi:MAG: HEAT repeat domain-containing protein [Anaerolineales bacterium]|nr:HEAT repeat domain-containing protein [Anaerolineales bacterium]
MEVLAASTDEDERYEAAKYLADHPDTHAIGALAIALCTGDEFVRFWAAHALGVTQHPDAVLPLCGALRDIESDVRDAAADALAEVADERAVQPLMRAFLREGLGRNALVRIGQPSVTALLAALEAKAHLVGHRIVLVEALAEIADPRVGPALLGILHDGNEPAEVRQTAGECVTDLDDGKYYAEAMKALELLSWMQDDDPFKHDWVDDDEDEVE